MIKIEYYCDKCGNKKYSIGHGWSNKISGYVYYIECITCHEETVIGDDGEYNTSK